MVEIPRLLRLACRMGMIGRSRYQTGIPLRKIGDMGSFA
jgi:hypothetical protein